MSLDVIALCPGQGAQAVGMGRAWRDASEIAAATLAEADAILGDAFGAPLSTICIDGPAEILNRTDVGQPAIFACSVARARALAATTGWTVRAAAGLSLGEYTALHLAGAFSFADGLRLVARRGRLMQDAAEASDSGMVALIGADEAQAESVCDAARAGGVLVCANFNAPGQIVLSGDAAACDRAVEVAGASGVRCSRLTVAGAFHSPLMQSAADRMAEELAAIELGPLQIPVMSNVTGLAHDPSNPELLRRLLVEQIVRPVRWVECCLSLPADETSVYHELAPGSVLRGLMRRIERNRKVVSHDEPEEQVA